MMEMQRYVSIIIRESEQLMRSAAAYDTEKPFSVREVRKKLVRIGEQLASIEALFRPQPTRMAKIEDATPDDTALYLTLLTAQLHMQILQEHVDDHLDEQTYARLSTMARNADLVARGLLEHLEKQ